MRISKVLTVFLLAVGLALPLFATLTFAQPDSITLTLTVPEWMQGAFNEALLSEFEAQNPGMDVVLVLSGDSMYFGSAAYAPDAFFEGATEYAQTADVLYVDNYRLSPESTRAGLFLDLSPLTTSDPSFNPDDFFPAAWQSFQWDGGIWGLPASLSLNVLVYNKTRFDELGLAYPNEAWTIDDFANAVRALSETNAEGKVTIPGLLDWGMPGLLLRALLGEGVYDSSVIPNSVNFQNPELEHLLTVWGELSQEGHTGRNYSPSSQSLSSIPMRIEGLSALVGKFGDSNDEWAGALLPGGAAGVRVQGFAVSAGTQHPEQAYALVKFLTSNPQVVNRMFGDSPARQSLVGVEPADGAIIRNLSDEAEALRDQALSAALPVSEMRFMDYVSMALNKMDPQSGNLDVAAALQEAETAALEVLQAADERRNSAPVIVAQPSPTPVLAAGEISMRFLYAAHVAPLPNRELWEQAIQDFVAADPEVGQIELLTGLGGMGQATETEYDCYVQPYNLVPNMDLQTVLNLDPFLNEDPGFDRNDFLSGVLSQMTREDLIWGIPLFIQPEVLWYNSQTFTDRGAQLPENGWTADQFIDTLQTLRPDPDDPAPFVPRGPGSTYVLLLTAAFGGAPLDYRTDPPTVHFTDPATVDALRQVLDLAKDGYIEYSALGNMSGGVFSSGPGATITIYNEALGVFSQRLRPTRGDYTDPYRMTTFPRGAQFSGIAYEIGAGYIRSDAPNPEACYRWLSYLSSRPELFGSMPARRSALGALEDTMAQGSDLNAVFNEIDALLQDPATLVLPSQFTGGGSIGGYLLPVWLNRALDAYVLEDADLETELKDAELIATAYLDCISSIQEIPMSDLGEMPTEEQIAYGRQFVDCAISVDPSLESVFAYPEE